jgi:RNA polymerase sigma-70 factor (ECF subfamily)
LQARHDKRGIATKASQRPAWRRLRISAPGSAWCPDDIEWSGGKPVAISTAAWRMGSGVTIPSESTADRAFIEELFALHHSEIYAYLVRMLRDSELAADLAQDTFIKAYRAQDSLEDRAKARAWLYQIAHRVALDEIRHRRIVRFLPWTGESHGAAPSAEHLAMETRLSGPMARAIARIPERQRAALLMAEVNDLTGLELAEALGVSHVAARALLTRARESLRQALADERNQEKEKEAAIDFAFAERTRAADPRAQDHRPQKPRHHSDDSTGVDR